ncbi:hypothetical protein WN48_11053 [Eufriesea mexicana]|nr:hypothetical protein WN48_11053 [Eufriesea mexicana]
MDREGEDGRGWARMGDGDGTEGVDDQEKNGTTTEGRRDAKKREIDRSRERGEGNTWPHPDFTHATTRVDEETERGVAAASSDHGARETLRLCGQD